MNREIYLLSVWLHILAAMAWLGGMLFLSLVLVPALKRLNDRALAVELMRASGRRFRLVGWVCLAVLLATGLENLAARGITLAMAQTAAFWRSSFGQILAFKFAAVALVLSISALHDFYVGPRAARALQDQPDSPEALRLRALASWFGRFNVLLALLATACGVMLVRGQPW